MRLEITVKWSVRMALHQKNVPRLTPDDGDFRIFPKLKEGSGSLSLSSPGNEWYVEVIVHDSIVLAWLGRGSSFGA